MFAKSEQRDQIDCHIDRRSARCGLAYNQSVTVGEDHSLLLSIGLEAELGSAALGAEELRVHTLGGGVTLAGGTFDAVSVLLTGLVVSSVVLRLSHDLI